VLAINFARKIENGSLTREAERAERVVVLLAEKAWLQHQRSGEKNGEPEKAGAKFARTLRWSD